MTGASLGPILRGGRTNSHRSLPIMASLQRQAGTSRRQGDLMQPNFLLFITDQQRADHVCSYGNAMLRTPALDALAAQGWSADRFYVGSPICMPNRATMMTGRMPSVHGVRHNGIPLSQRATTFVERLRGAGYATALIGKSHLQNMTGKGPLWPPP